MSNWQTHTLPRTNETYYSLTHSSGLPIFVFPKEGRTTYALFATRYGSIDNAFVAAGESKPTVLPAGIAHYLEHKLFENEDCDAFDRYAKTGANANAYTTFDHTAYLFACTQNVGESLDILLDFVQSPYFTEQTVEKERGIIGQEIRMGEDSPSRRVLHNLLKALYQNHPINTDIAGTVESIADITPQLLYSCYNQFYNLHNMVLVVAGDVTCELVQAAADKNLKRCSPAIPTRAALNEPTAVAQPLIEEYMPVAKPLLFMGYKVAVNSGEGLPCESPRDIAAAAVLSEYLGGKGSRLYAELLQKEQVNASFEVGYWNGPGYGCWLIGAETDNPDAVCAAFQDEVKRLRRDGLDTERFLESRNAVYGRMICETDDVEGAADLLLEAYLDAKNPAATLDEVAGIDIQSVYRRLVDDFDETACAVSKILPVKE